MKRFLKLSLSILFIAILQEIGTAKNMFFANINESEKSFSIKTERFEVVFRDAMIIGLKNNLTGEVIADERLTDNKIPRGLGCISENVDSMSKSHIPWGCQELNQHFSLGTMFPNYHYPCEKSTFTAKKDGNGVNAVWKGLTNETIFFPEESLQINAGVDPETGALILKASGYSPAGGVFGIQIPVVNVSGESRMFIPHFGGMMFDKSIRQGLVPLGGAPFIEAPVVAFETKAGSFSVWKEDPEFHPYYVFYSWNGKNFFFAFEHLNLMPFEDKKSIKSAAFRIDVFDGNWKSAMTPYKKWHEEFFQKELKIRNSMEWANRIRVVIDNFDCSPKTLRKAAELFDPETVMFHFWNARAPKWDTELPDWTPRKEYAEGVKNIHDFGFKVMAYVNTYCINYNSPVFIRDNIKEKFLTRKSSVWKYNDAKKKNPESIAEMLIGTIQGNNGKDPYENIKDGQLIYGDPLSKKWRKYHVEQMKWWNKITGTDANYEDTAGCVGDFGNGIVNGKSAGQGSVAIMRELLAAQPQVAMASEYGPSEIAFAVRWPLVYAQVWGNDNFKKANIHRQYPVNAFLFGYTPWIPTARVNSDFLMHLVTACSDALGGMGQMWGNVDSLNSNTGFIGHMKWRAQIFSRRRLTPDFTQPMNEKNLICLYKDFEGRHYKYFDDGKVQKMTGPDGNDLYARVDNSSTVKTKLSIPGWPAQKDGIIFALNPEKRYALFPESNEKTDLQIISIPEKTAVKSYRSGKDFALLVLDKTDKTALSKGRISLKLNRAFSEICINRRKEVVGNTTQLQSGHTFETDFPAYILLSENLRVPKPGQRIGDEKTDIKVQDSSGGSEFHGKIEDLARFKNEITDFFISGSGKNKEIIIDFPFRAPDNKTALKFYVKNGTYQNGNGTVIKVFINGEPVKSLDCTRENSDGKNDMPEKDKILWDNDCHEWIIPLVGFNGKNVLLTIAVDAKGNENGDRQLFSIPVLINDEPQKFSEKIYKGK